MAYFGLAFYSKKERGGPVHFDTEQSNSKVNVMFDDLTWDAILQGWPWFGAAAVVFVVAVGLFIALKPKPKRQAEEAAESADKKDWALTGRIDFADSQSVGAFVLEVEETRISISPSGVEHGEIRWRRAALPEAKMVIEVLPCPTESLHVGDFRVHCDCWDETKRKRASR